MEHVKQYREIDLSDYFFPRFSVQMHEYRNWKDREWRNKNILLYFFSTYMHKTLHLLDTLVCLAFEMSHNCQPRLALWILMLLKSSFISFSFSGKSDLLHYTDICMLVQMGIFYVNRCSGSETFQFIFFTGTECRGARHVNTEKLLLLDFLVL